MLTLNVVDLGDAETAQMVCDDTNEFTCAGFADTLRAQGGATHVTYSLSVELAIPMLGMLKRKGERMVMDQALKELKKRVESMTA